MLKRFPVYHIPYGLDTDAYKPLDTDECRHMLGIPRYKKVLMFMAKSLHSPVKGGDLLVSALRSLPESLKANLVLLLLGNEGQTLIKDIDIQTFDLGYVSSDRLKAMCYSAADLFVHPTRADAFGLVLLESMACGTPMVSYRVGGVTDLVRPGITGYLAQPGDVMDLSNGIIQLLEDEPLRDAMREKCRAIAVKEFPIELQVQRYIELYRQLSNGTKEAASLEEDSLRRQTMKNEAGDTAPVIN
jgi:glycosyltransferase involved in cell wall biosynthesis